MREPVAGGHGGDALWNDDFHHTARVALTGKREAYYLDYTGSPQELVSAAKYGYLYQGQWYGWQGKRRGTPGLDLPPSAFVAYLENHDQVANTPFGHRLHQMPRRGCSAALTALTLLGPANADALSGQEFASSAPFLTLPITKRSSGSRCRRAAGVPVAVSQRGRSGRDRPLPSPVEALRSTAASWIRPSASGTASGTRCTAISFTCGAPIR